MHVAAAAILNGMVSEFFHDGGVSENGGNKKSYQGISMPTSIARLDTRFVAMSDPPLAGRRAMASSAQHHQGDGPTSSLGLVSMGKEQRAVCSEGLVVVVVAGGLVEAKGLRPSAVEEAGRVLLFLGGRLAWHSITEQEG